MHPWLAAGMATPGCRRPQAVAAAQAAQAEEPYRLLVAVVQEVPAVSAARVATAAELAPVPTRPKACFRGRQGLGAGVVTVVTADGAGPVGLVAAAAS
jgi:hypothetical protein